MPPSSSPRKRLRQRFALRQTPSSAPPSQTTRISPVSNPPPISRVQPRNADIAPDISRVLQLQSNQGLARRAEEDFFDEETSEEDEDLSREDLLEQAGSGEGTSVLDLGQDPLAQQGPYGQSPAAPPGSAADTASEVTTDQGGGYMGSGGQERAALLEKQKQQARTQQLLQPGGERRGPSTDGSQSTPSQKSSPSQRGSGRAGGDKLDQAEQVASLLKMQKAQQAVRKVQELQEVRQRLQRISKAAKTFWNLIKTGELAAGMSVVTLITLWAHLNIQMLNKLIKRTTDTEVPLIGTTYWFEDILIICFDCMVGISACTASPCFILFIAAILIAAAAFGVFEALDFFGILNALF